MIPPQVTDAIEQCSSDPSRQSERILVSRAKADNHDAFNRTLRAHIKTGLQCYPPDPEEPRRLRRHASGDVLETVFSISMNSANKRGNGGRDWAMIDPSLDGRNWSSSVK